MRSFIFALVLGWFLSGHMASADEAASRGPSSVELNTPMPYSLLFERDYRLSLLTEPPPVVQGTAFRLQSVPVIRMLSAVPVQTFPGTYHRLGSTFPVDPFAAP